MEKMDLPDSEWRKRLAPEQYQVLRQAGTERAFTGRYVDNHDDGEYRCAGCGAPLFESDDKFESGSGWPSFTKPADGEAVIEHRDVSHGMVPSVTVTSATSSPMAQDRKACASASIRRRWISIRRPDRLTTPNAVRAERSRSTGFKRYLP